MPFGLTTEGFVPMTLADLLADIKARVWANISSTLDLSERTYEGQLVAIVAYHLAILWELAEAQNGSMNPNKALKAALDALCLLSGTYRPAASYSIVTLKWIGDPLSVIPTATTARVPDGPRFESMIDATLTACDAWVVATLYGVGDLVTANGSVFRCRTAGTSAGSGTGPDSADDPVADADITDGTAHWAYLGEGTAQADAIAKATETGPLSANAGTITEIVTSTGGLNDVYNVLDATVGRAQATDAELRILRELELAQPGTSPADAIRAALLSLGGVTNATVFVNNEDTTNGDGMPPHSVEAMVQGGDDQAIFDCLLANVAAGIQSHGTEVGSATDSQGTAHVEKFTRPDEIEIYVEITLVKDPAYYPTDGDTLVKEAITAWGRDQATGKNAVASRIGAAAFDVIGVIDVTATLISVAPGPTLSTTIAINLRELATYDTSRIDVITSDGVP